MPLQDGRVLPVVERTVVHRERAAGLVLDKVPHEAPGRLGGEPRRVLDVEEAVGRVRLVLDGRERGRGDRVHQAPLGREVADDVDPAEEVLDEEPARRVPRLHDELHGLGHRDRGPGGERLEVEDEAPVDRRRLGLGREAEDAVHELQVRQPAEAEGRPRADADGELALGARDAGRLVADDERERGRPPDDEAPGLRERADEDGLLQADAELEGRPRERHPVQRDAVAEPLAPDVRRRLERVLDRPPCFLLSLSFFVKSYSIIILYMYI